MSKNELVYLDLLRGVLNYGDQSDDRTGVGTISLFGPQCTFDLKQGFPLMTTKEIPWKGIVSELLWFIEGSGNERRLAELRYGKDASELEGKKTIWTPNANASYWKPKASYDGDLGRIYGVQWRDWQTPVWNGDGTVSVKRTDQLKNLIEGIKSDPSGRRHLLTAWNPGELDQMALPPCHVLSQFRVTKRGLSCKLYMRK